MSLASTVISGIRASPGVAIERKIALSLTATDVLRQDRRTFPRVNSSQPDAGTTAGPSEQFSKVLLADPGSSLLATLRPALFEVSGRILHVRSMPEIQQLVAGGMAGDLALVNVRFHTDTPGLIGALRDVGWARVIALTTLRIPLSTVVDAVNAGATGVLTVVEPAPQTVWPVALLTVRELQVVRLVADGRSNKAIAARLSISALTVKNHLARVGRKMGAGDRAHIVAIACRSGMIIDPDGSPYGVGPAH